MHLQDSCWLVSESVIVSAKSSNPSIHQFLFQQVNQNFDRISQFRPNFTISPKYHNFVQISQFRPNFTILLKDHNFAQISQFNLIYFNSINITDQLILQIVIQFQRKNLIMQIFLQFSQPRNKHLLVYLHIVHEDFAPLKGTTVLWFIF